MSENRKRKLDKSTLAQTFRFDCDRFLRFRLATPEERDGINLGNERYSRPGIAQIRGAGRRWEADQYEDLITAFGEGDSRVWFERATEEDENARRRMFLPVTNLRALLRQDSPPEVLLEAEYELLPDAVPGLAQAYREFDLDSVKMRPDILWIRPARSGAPLISNPVPDSIEYEIHVIDVKMVKEPNLRHFTEVTYYALALAQIINAWGLQSRYAVSAQGYIWPGSYVQHRFRDLLAQHQTESSPLTATLLDILVPIPYEVYQVHVREFFQSRLMPVLRTDVAGTAWHVQPSCALCDYLKFCREQAQRDDHLSRVAWLSRGQAEALRQNGISTTAELATAILDRTANWQNATVTSQQLRANEPALAARAEALASQTVVLAEGRKAASMPKWTDMNIFLSIHSDPGSGLVFALGVSHVYWHPGRAPGEAPRKDRDPHVFVVTSAGDFRNDRVMRSENERQRLSEFLDLIMSWLQEVDAHNQQVRRDYRQTGGKKKVAPGQKTAHFFVWDAFEIKQLRRLIERHMNHPDIQAKIELLLRFFPPDSVMPTDVEAYRSQPGTAVKDVFKLLIGVPVAHDYTLFEVANAFYPNFGTDGQPYRFGATYGFSTPLTDQIPFERAYELWTSRIALTHRDDARPREQWRVFTWDEVYNELKRTIKTRLRALDHVVSKLRQNHGRLLTLRKMPFSVAEPRRMNIPAAGQQLDTLEKLDEATRDIENRALRALPIDEREARFHSMRGLQRASETEFVDVIADMKAQTPRLRLADLYVFHFPASSADSRVREGAFTYALSNEINPVDPGAEPFDLDTRWPLLLGMDWEEALRTTLGADLPSQFAYVAVSRLLGAEIIAIESAPAEHEPYIVIKPREKRCFDFALALGLIDLDSLLVLDPLHQDFTTVQVEKVLRAVGRPRAARRASRT